MQDPHLELAQAGPRVDAEILREHRARPAVGAKCVRLSARAIERDDELLPAALSIGRRRYPLLEVGDELARLAERQGNGCPVFLSVRAQFEKAQPLADRERRVGELLVRLATPQG